MVSVQWFLWGCLKVWLWLLFKVLFTQKSMPIIFFYFLKIIFEISTLKWFENIKNILLQSKKKNLIFLKALLKSTPKQALKEEATLHYSLPLSFGLLYLVWVVNITMYSVSVFKNLFKYCFVFYNFFYNNILNDKKIKIINLIFFLVTRFKKHFKKINRNILSNKTLLFCVGCLYLVPSQRPIVAEKT